MIHILQVVGSLRIGGLETVAMNCMRYADTTEYQFDFLVFGEQVGDYEAEAIECGCNVIHIPAPGKSYRAYYKKLCEVMKHGKYDIVHSHVFFNSGIVLLAAKKCGVPVRIAHAHSVKRKSDKGIRKAVFQTVMRKLLVKYATKFCACSKQAGEYVFSKEAFEEKGMVLPNCIDVSKFAFSEENRKRIRRELSINENAVVIGQVGHLTQAKNQKFLLDLFSEFLKTNPAAMLLLVGDGELRNELETQIASLGIDKSVRLTGTRSDIGALLSAMDVYVCTSTNEGFGITLLEAKANGLPCVIEEETLVDEIQELNHNHIVKGFNNVRLWLERIEEALREERNQNIAYSVASSKFNSANLQDNLKKLY